MKNLKKYLYTGEAALQHQPQAEPAICQIKLVHSIVFLAESGNRTHSQAVIFPLGYRQTMTVKGYLRVAGVGELQYDTGNSYYPAADLPLLPGKLHIGMDGIFQSVGKNNSQFALVSRKCIGQRNSGMTSIP